jgi:transglutaminase-like putative cysteine protease
MRIDRRTLMQGGAIVALDCALRGFSVAAPASPPAFAPFASAWRRFELTTSIEVTAANGPTTLWIPVPGFEGRSWNIPIKTYWTTNAATAEWRRADRYKADFIEAHWRSNSVNPRIEVRSVVAIRDRAVDLSHPPGHVVPLTDGERQQFTSGTKLQPLNTQVKELSDKIVAGASSDVDKVRRIYDWVVEYTFRDPKTTGCGTGDIMKMVATGSFGGKCADLNGLFVGLVRASGVPARDIYGIRVGPSRFGYMSLGANTTNVTKAQHCRAETYLTGFGWVPMDPADVRKVMLEEPPGNLPAEDPVVAAVRNSLFGAWEGNWVAYNDASDVPLPHSIEGDVPFLMYPVFEAADGRPLSFDSDKFRYVISVKELIV